MSFNDGVLDKELNPFFRQSWADQNYKFTKDRAVALEKLLGLTIKEIKEIDDDNISNYPAFVAIRWGYAEISNIRLVGTKKWALERDHILEGGG